MAEYKVQLNHSSRGYPWDDTSPISTTDVEWAPMVTPAIIDTFIGGWKANRHQTRPAHALVYWLDRYTDQIGGQKALRLVREYVAKESED